LLGFYNSDTLSSIKGSVQLITERVSAKERETFIKRAATDGKVLANGGIHVLQTFFSKELSEEYQIMGRRARQGDRDSYRMILLENDLEWIFGAPWENEVKKIKGSILYETLDKECSKLYENSSAGRELGIAQCTSDHNSSKNFLDALITGDIDRVKKFLLEQNRGPNIDSPVSRTVLLMDASGSMSNLLSATKETICTMFERAWVVLGEKGLPNDTFAMQFAFFAWETKGSHLRMFMNTISSEGGMGRKAIEIGLWYAPKEGGTKESISQVILIGRAPANTQPE
ncbi:unnamed protein product, partial [Rotaria sordida]